MSNTYSLSFLRGLNEPATFMGVPFSGDPAGSQAAFLGIPFDCGQHPTRIGARGGPRAIRAQSSLVRRYQPPFADFDPLSELKAVDLGDLDVNSGMLEEASGGIEAGLAYVLGKGVTPITFGGDGAVTLPQLRAVREFFPDLVAVHLDAHTDTSAGDGPCYYDRYNTATTFTRAAEEGLVDPSGSFHVGGRGTLPLQGTHDHTEQQGYNLITGDMLFKQGISAVAHEIHLTVGNRPVYLCFDMDFFDPSCAPGVCTPTWGGPTAREGLQLLRALAGLNFVAVDINTVSPDHDAGGMTAFLAGTVALECATMVALNKRKSIATGGTAAIETATSG
ncbi:arginase family protein [Leisingera sp. F5]|uniref:arginase family protein n=1 Tax=Leisingera sp. F5 TaxID=1813816 RepID=UPI000A7EA600|nr:arginase family protein [Leisingera sp. F5]